MKTKFKITIILMILLSISSFAQQSIRPLVSDRTSGRLMIYAGFDFYNAIVGGKLLENGYRRNPPSLDAKFGFFVEHNNWEGGIFVEKFPTIHYLGYGLQIARQVRFPAIFTINTTSTDLVFSFGGELTFVDRRSLPLEDIPPRVTIGRQINWGASFKGRLDGVIWSWMFLEFQGLLTFRYDISHIWGRDSMPSGVFPALWDQRSFYLNLGVRVLEW